MKLFYQGIILFSILSIYSVTSQEEDEDYGEFDCEGKPSDVFFVLDASNSIWTPYFHLQLKFVNHVIRRFKIGKEHMRVGVLTFSNGFNLQFKLSSDKEEMLKKVSDINHDGGLFTHTAEAINFVYTKGMTKEYGARDDVLRLGIVITDGLSSNRTSTAIEAKKAREAGIHMFAIGVGPNYDIDELYTIASEPSENYVFQAKSFTTLDRLKNLLAAQACKVTDPPTSPLPTTSPLTTEKLKSATPVTKVESDHYSVAEFRGRETEFREKKRTGGNGDGDDDYNDEYGVNSEGDNELPPAFLDDNTYSEENLKLIDPKELCKYMGPMDVVFIIDEKRGGLSNLKRMWESVRAIVADLDMENEKTRVKFIAQCAKFPGIQLGEFSNKTNLLKRLKELNQKPRATHELLREMSDSFTKSKEDGASRKRVAVYLTDGKVGDLHTTLAASQGAQFINDITIHGVGIGNHVDEVELRAIVSCPTEDNLHLVKHYTDLKSITKKLTWNLCKDFNTSG